MVHIMVKVHILGRKVPEGLMLYTICAPISCALRNITVFV